MQKQKSMRAESRRQERWRSRPRGRQQMLNYKLAQKGSLSQHSAHLSYLKLPLIDKKHSEQDRKSQSKLRSSRLQLLSFHDPTHNPRASALSNVDHHNPSELVDINLQEIGEQMQVILGKNPAFNSEYYNNENENFEKDILRNKEILRLQRQKRSSLKDKEGKEQKEVREGREGESQRGKDRDDTAEGIKRKSRKKRASRLQVLEGNRNEQQRIGGRSKQHKRRESGAIHKSKSSFLLTEEGQKGFITNRLQKKMHELKQKLGQRRIGESRLLTEGDIDEQRSENLFDNIHKYLVNPHRQPQPSKPYPQLASRRQALQLKLRDIEEKLHSPQTLTNRTDPPSDALSPPQIHAGQWRRVQIHSPAGGKNLSVCESSFEGQMAQLGRLQTRNEHSLERYVQNQRMLADLQLFRSASRRDGQNR